MAVHLDKHGISYFSVPKCACTSIKTMFFEMENGFSFREFTVNGAWFHIHKLYPTQIFDLAAQQSKHNSFKFTVIRSPYARLASCYKHWVAPANSQQLLRQKQAELNARNVPTTPDWVAFVEHLQTYRELFAHIKHHTQPLSYFLGHDPDYFDRIYNLSNIADLGPDLEKRTGISPAMQHHNKSSAAKSVQAETMDIENKIRELFAQDFALYGTFWEECSSMKQD